MVTNKKINREAEITYKKINAVGNKIRIALMGLLYIKGKSSFTNLLDETNIDSNKLSYHINILLEAKFIILKKKEKKYNLTKEGLQLLDDLGFINRIKDIVAISDSMDKLNKKCGQVFFKFPSDHVLEWIGGRAIPYYRNVPLKFRQGNPYLQKVIADENKTRTHEGFIPNEQSKWMFITSKTFFNSRYYSNQLEKKRASVIECKYIER